MSVIRQLIHLGGDANIAQHSALQLTEAARPVLRGESSLQLAVPRIVAQTESDAEIVRRQL